MSDQPDPNPKPVTKVADATGNKFGIDFKSIAAAAAARSALAPVRPQPQAVPPTAEQPQTGGNPNETPWAPPGRMAGMEQTRRAEAAAAARGLRPVASRRGALMDFVGIDDSALVAAGQDWVRSLEDRLRLVPGDEARRIGANRPAVVPETTTDMVDRSVPVVVSNGVANIPDVVPDWHAVTNLSGYRAELNRKASRAAFGEVVPEALEKFFVISTPLNPERDVQAVARWINAHAERDDRATIDFNRSFPDFSAEFLVYKDKGSRYVVTRDVGGVYVYVAPRSDAPSRVGVDESARIEAPTQARRSASSNRLTNN